MDGAKLEFKVQIKPKGSVSKVSYIKPKWCKVDVENANCPQCEQIMTVVLGDKGLLYAYCARCQQYYVGE